MNMMTNEQIAKIEEMRRDIEKWEGHILLTSEEYCVHLLAEIDRLRAKLEEEKLENKTLRRAIDNLKMKGWEIGNKDMHDAALQVLRSNDDD